MTNEPRPKTQITDPTGRHVAANVRRIREARGWSTYELARLLKDAGRQIAPSAIAKVERAERRVDVGDLAAFAVVFNVSPSALLLPLDDDPAHTLEVTGTGEVPADVAWDWMDGRRPLKVAPGSDVIPRLEYDLYSRPPHRRHGWAAIRDLLPQEALAKKVILGLAQEEPKGGDDGSRMD